MTARHLRWVGIIAAIVALSLLVYGGVIKMGWEPWKLRKARFWRAADRSKSLVEAIKKFHTERGQAPASLEELVPAYLAKVPRTGLIDYPDFIYTRFTNTYYSLRWWDLGTRGGKPIAGLWCYQEGDPDHAILGLTLDQQQRVVEARVDRMPNSHAELEFDSVQWKQKQNRIEMVRTWARKINVIGQGTNEITKWLGQADGESVLRNAPWELRIECPSGMGFDVFFYWPTESYPAYIYGGDAEVINGWAYVHE